MPEYVPLRKRSLLMRLFRAPRLFWAHYRLLKSFGPRLAAMRAAAMLTVQIFR